MKLIVTTRVAAGDGVMQPEIRENIELPEAPTESWVAARERFLDELTAASLRLVSVPFVWVWFAHQKRHDQVCEMRDRVFPEAIVCPDDAMTCDEVWPDDKAFITARVDSDDALMPAAIDDLHGKEFTPNTLVNWGQGWKYHIDHHLVSEYGRPWRRQGPYLAAANYGRERMLQTFGHHVTARERCGQVHNVLERSWIMGIHGEEESGNLMNRWARNGQQVKPLSEDEANAILERAGVLEAVNAS